MSDIRAVDANELLKESIYCRDESGTNVYAVPVRKIFEAPILKGEGMQAVSRWEDYRDYRGDRSGYCVCMNCKRMSTQKYRYCPNCGARMDDGND